MQNHVMPGHMDREIKMGQISLPSWIEKILTKERVVVISLVAITISVLGLDLFTFYKALQDYTVMGTPYY